MESLQLNIDGLRFPVDEDEKQARPEKPPGKGFSKVLSSLKSGRKPYYADENSAAPNEYLPTDYKTFLILRDFLQPDTKISLEQAHDSILEIYPDGQTDNMRSINNVCLELSEQIPYHHPSHLKLVQTLWLLGRSPRRTVKSSCKDAGTASYSFYQNLQEDIVDSLIHPGDDDTSLERYVNSQAFLANLMDFAMFLPRSSFAEKAMRGAFGGAHESDHHETWVMGAAQWIIWAGPALFKDILFNRDMTPKITMEDWQSWKSGFKAVVDENEMGEECKKVAGKAVDMMEALGRVLSF